MTTMNVYYCTFCSWLSRRLDGIYATLESVGAARAASQLARMGYHEQAKALMLMRQNGKL
jgi:hypothetical protein